MTVKETLEQYMKYIKITKSKATYRFNEGKSKRIFDFFDKVDSKTVNRAMILDFIVYLKNKNPNISNATINKYVGLLLRALKNECNIVIKFDKLRESKKIMKTIPNEIIKKVFDYYENSPYPEHLRNNVMFRLLLDTGLRISELLSIKTSNINFSDCSILVTRTKTDEERVVFYTKPTEILLNKYIMRQQLKDYIFIDLNTRKPLKLDRIEKICQNLQKKLKTKYSLSPHKWRHTFATHFTNNNGNMEVLRKLMGHSNILTTQRYLHINLQTIRNEYFRIYNEE